MSSQSCSLPDLPGSINPDRTMKQSPPLVMPSERDSAPPPALPFPDTALPPALPFPDTAPAACVTGSGVEPHLHEMQIEIIKELLAHHETRIISAFDTALKRCLSCNVLESGAQGVQANGRTTNKQHTSIQGRLRKHSAPDEMSKVNDSITKLDESAEAPLCVHHNEPVEGQQTLNKQQVPTSSYAMLRMASVQKDEEDLPMVLDEYDEPSTLANTKRDSFKPDLKNMAETLRKNASRAKHAAHSAFDLASAQGWLKNDSRDEEWSKVDKTISGKLAQSKFEQHRKHHSRILISILDSSAFECFIGIMIVLNAILIAIQTDYAAAHPWEDLPGWFDALDLTFTSVFFIEVMLRISIYRIRFFLGPERAWDMFDLVIVGISVVNVIVKLAAGPENGQGHFAGASVARIVRVIRLVKLVRLIRVLRFFRELRIMMYSVMNCVKPLLWAILLLLFIIFMLGIYITQLVTSHVRQNPHLLESELTTIYGRLPRTLLSLFMAMSGGDDWGNLAAPLVEIHPAFAPLYALYIAFCMLAMLNVMTGVFVDSAISSAQSDRDEVAQEEIRKQDSYLNEVRAMFKEADEDGTGLISWDEFEKYVDDKRVVAYFHSLGLDFTEAKGLFKLLDTQDDGSISTDEFMMGCLRLKGQAKTLDLATLMYENRRMADRFDHSLEDIQNALLILCEHHCKLSESMKEQLSR